MNKTIILFILVFLILMPVPKAAAQSSSGTSSSSTDTETDEDASKLPQWVKDMRRFDIITFGSFPFSMFTVTFITDLARWGKENNMDFSEEGRRYAPWPLKSAGAVEMTTWEYQRTIIIAASVSLAVAITDMIIVLIKRNKERRRIESRSTGSATINKVPYGLPDEPEEEAGVTDEPNETDEEPDSELE